MLLLKSAKTETNYSLILSISKNKIVYSGFADINTARKDCFERKGIFNTCGRICDDEESCNDKCYFTCESDDKIFVADGEWQIFESRSGGFAVSYPNKMMIGKNKNMINLILNAPDGSGDVFRGIVVSIEKLATTKNFFKTVSDEFINDTGSDDKSLILDRSSKYQSYIYQVSENKAAVFLKNDSGFFKITYQVRDPYGQEYMRVVTQMLDSFVPI